MKKLLILTLVLLFLGGCSDETDNISATLGTDVSGGEILISEDSHGGFHGDGETFIIFQFRKENEFSVPEGPFWHPLPLTENLNTVLYGNNQMLTDDAGNPRVPEIENGWYFFCDRHSKSTDPTKDAGLFSRGSLNFTLAVYDTDTYTLYFYEQDT